MFLNVNLMFLIHFYSFTPQDHLFPPVSLFSLILHRSPHEPSTIHHILVLGSEKCDCLYKLKVLAPTTVFGHVASHQVKVCSSLCSLSFNLLSTIKANASRAEQKCSSVQDRSFEFLEVLQVDQSSSS